MSHTHTHTHTHKAIHTFIEHPALVALEQQLLCCHFVGVVLDMQLNFELVEFAVLAKASCAKILITLSRLFS